MGSMGLSVGTGTKFVEHDDVSALIPKLFGISVDVRSGSMTGRFTSIHSKPN